MPDRIDGLLAALDRKKAVIAPRVSRYTGANSLRFTADPVESQDIANFRTNLYRVAVDSVAERIRVRGLQVSAAGQDLSEIAWNTWVESDCDQLIPIIIREALATGSGVATVVTRHGRPRVIMQDTREIITTTDPITGETNVGLKSWTEHDAASGAVKREYVALYTPEDICIYVKGRNWQLVSRETHSMGQVPVVTMTNCRALCGTHGYSVIDDLAPLVDALSKVLADMLVASEDVARPKRWASGVDLEEDETDGFVADDGVGMGEYGAQDQDGENAPVLSPFEDGSRMWTTESSEAKFGQLPGADLVGYKTAADLLRQEIMSIGALPAHLMGVTTANPASAEATRAAELSLTASSESAISVLGPAIERIARLIVAAQTGHRPESITARALFDGTDTRSVSQETDSVTKLYSLGLLTVDEARDRLGVNHA